VQTSVCCKRGAAYYLCPLQVWQPDGQYSHVAVSAGNLAFTFWISFGKDKPTGAKARCHYGAPPSPHATRSDPIGTWPLLTVPPAAASAQGQLFGLALLDVRGDGKVQRLVEFRQLTSVEEAELVKEPYQSGRWEETTGE